MSEAAVMTSDPLEFYKSLTNEQRAVERDLLMCAMDNNVLPASLRYGLFRDTWRGAIKSLTGEVYYFQMPPNQIFHIVKAATDDQRREAEHLLQKCQLGCDIVKHDDQKEEDEKKAAGAVGTLPPASEPEAANVATQDQQVTQVHPGATAAQTPQQDGSTERWHGGGDLERALPPIDNSVNPHAWSTDGLMKAWGQQLQQTGEALQKSAPRVAPMDPQLRRYMIEVVGKMPDEVDSGRVHLSAIQRAQYNEWLTKSLRGRMDGLAALLKGNRGA